MDIAKVSLIGMGGVILCFLLKGTRPEYASFVTMGIGLLILGLAVGKLKYLFESLESLKEILPVSSENISVLAKMIGITYIGQFSAGICRDAGYQATGAQVELFCKLSILVLSIPVMMALLETIREFLV